MSRWPTVALAETATAKGLVGGPFGSSLVGADYVESGVPVIRGTNLNGGRELRGDYVFVSDAKVSSDLSRNVAKPGDLVFTQRGTLGQLALVPSKPYPRYVVSQSQMRLRVDPEIASSSYLFYACSAPSFLRQINDNAIATGVPHINLGILARLEVPFPGINEQRAIGEVLGALDDKIAVNAAFVQTTEDLLSARFAALHLDEEPKPHNEAIRLDDVIELNPKIPAPSEIEPVYVDMQKLPVTGMSIAQWTHRPAKGGARFQNGDTLLARITPCLENRKTAYVDFLDEGQVAIGSTEYIVMRSRPGVPSGLSFFLAISDRFRAFGIRHMLGTSGRQRLSAGDLRDYRLRATDNVALESFGLASKPLLVLVRRRTAETRTLIAMRDVLLPQLMAGKIRVKDAEQMLGDVV